MSMQIPPPLPSVAQFKTATTPKYLIKKPGRTHIGVLDEALARWKNLEGQPGMWHPKRKAAAELVALCRYWLDQRSTKKDKGTYSMRKQQVEGLGQRAFAWLQYVTFESAKWDKANLAKIGNAGAAHFRAAQPLSGVYRNERRIYEANAKTTAPSLSNIHEGMPLLVADPSVGGPQKLIAQKNFQTLTMADVQLLDSELGKLISAQNVWFMPKTERMQFMLVIQNGRFYSGFNEPFVPKGYYMYAINEYGNIFCTKANRMTPTQTVAGGRTAAARFNHSSFNAGKDVVCAGCIDTHRGTPTIDNDSGHYAPTTQQLHNAICMLGEEGLDLSQWQVGVRQPDGSKAIFMASLFRADMNVPVARAVAVV